MNEEELLFWSHVDPGDSELRIWTHLEFQVYTQVDDHILDPVKEGY